jgi:hypothetical protein
LGRHRYEIAGRRRRDPGIGDDLGLKGMDHVCYCPRALRTFV